MLNYSLYKTFFNLGMKDKVNIHDVISADATSQIVVLTNSVGAANDVLYILHLLCFEVVLK